MSRIARPAAGAALAAVLIAIAAVVILTRPSPYVVRAEFTDADGLTTHFDVRENGVVIGSVTGVSVTRSDSAMVTMELDKSATPLGAGASASIHPSNLLGEKYVALSAGNVRAPLPSGTVIPLGRTSVSPELDQVLSTFNANTRRATAVFLAEQGNALLGRGGDLAATLQQMPASLDAGRRLIAGLAQDNQALGRLVDESSAVLATAAPQRVALGHLVQRTDGFFTTLASREAGLRGTIDQAPSTIAELHTSLEDLQRAAAPLGPAAAGLRATAPSLTATLQALPSFTAAADPTLRTLTATAPTIVRLGRRATPLVDALQGAGLQLDRFSTAFRPFSTLLNHQFVPILDVLDGWARAIADRDGVGHIYRIEVTAPQSIITGALGAAGPPSHQRRGGLTSKLGGVTGRLPHAGGAPQHLTGLGSLVPTITTPSPTKPSGALGSLLHYLTAP